MLNTFGSGLDWYPYSIKHTESVVLHGLVLFSRTMLTMFTCSAFSGTVATKWW